MKLTGAAASLLAVTACAIVACTNGGGLGSIAGSGGGGGSPSPLPSAAIGLGIPTGKIGVENDPAWGTVSGYTQSQTSQVLAFPPGAKITVKNLSASTPHTLSVIGTASAPPAQFPQNPSLSFYPSGKGILGPTYGSGTLNGGDSVTIALANPGIYLIGCAYHYVELSMRDVIEVVAGATPGPTASPGGGGYAAPRTPPAQPVLSSPALVDQRGRSFTLASLRGEPLAVTFVSAHCTDACPLIDAQFAQAARRIEAQHVRARLLTVTLDPEHDSLSDMRAIARRFNAPDRFWLVAGGRRSDVHAVMRSFGVISVEGKHGENDRHTTFVYVIDGRGRLTRTMLASTALDDELLETLRDPGVAVAQ